MSSLTNMGGRPTARPTNEDDEEDVQAGPNMDLPSGVAEPGCREYTALRGKASKTCSLTKKKWGNPPGYPVLGRYLK